MNRFLLPLALLGACDCEDANEWDRTLNITIAPMDFDAYASGRITVRDGHGQLQFACAADFVPNPDYPDSPEQAEVSTHDCSPELLVSTSYITEWLTAFHVPKTFRVADVTVELFDEDGVAVDGWSEEIVVNWHGPANNLTCGVADGDILRTPTGKPTSLP